MKRAALLFSLLVLVIKVVIATRLQLFGDEAFYWQCAQRPAFAYVHLPFMTAMMIKLGTWILGDTTLGVRFFFLIMGGIFPWLVFVLARRLIGPQEAWSVLGCVLLTPALSYLGLLAIPDMPMLFFTALFLLTFEKATREGGSWLLLGLTCALGLATHNRFITAPMGAAVYMLLTPRGRICLRSFAWWPALPVAAVGLLPSLFYNLRHHFSPLAYYLTVRNTGDFRIGELFYHLGEQAAMVTPLLYVALIATLIVLWKRGQKDDDRALLVFWFALTPIALFLLASPFKRTGAQSMHWPTPGYLGLLVFLPGVLRNFVAGGQGWGRKLLAVSAPALGALAMLFLLVDLSFGLSKLKRPFQGWSEVTSRVNSHLKSSPDLKGVVADHYKLGAQLEYRSKTPIFILAHSKNFEHGRERQFDRWGMGERALRDHVGEDLLLVVESSETPHGYEQRWLAHLKLFFEPMTLLEIWTYEPSGATDDPRVFHFYRGTVISDH